MSPLDHLTSAEILELWSFCCRSTRQAIIQHQKSAHLANHRLAISSLLLLKRLKEEISGLVFDPEHRARLEWDYTTVLHLYLLLQPADHPDRFETNAPDAFEALVKAAIKSEIARINQLTE